MGKRVEGTMKLRANREAIDEWLGIVPWFTLILLVMGTALIVNGSWAETTDSDPTAHFPTGEITAIRGNEISIDGRKYSLSSNVVIKDTEGRQREGKDLVPGTLVRFLARGGQVNQIILILPR